MNSNFDLVIFDCDGVLVDSERIAAEVFASVLKDVCDLEFSLDQMFDHFVGSTEAQCLKIIEEMLGEQPPAELTERYEQNIDQALVNSVVAVAGIEQVLNEIRIPYCIASNGSHEKMQLTLGKTNLIDYFDNNIFSANDVERGKPFPDIFLHAARCMGVSDVRKCLVIEDSPIGVNGAVAAGMSVFGYSELVPEKKLIAAGAHRVFDKMALLPSLTVATSPLI